MSSDVLDLKPPTEEEKEQVLEQLNRLIQDPHFHNSKRYPSFLKFVVNQALEGKAHLLKERTIGVEVFGRNPDYDTTEDPIVRVTAAEIRKRIALYYQEPGHEQELRLMLASGSYVPTYAFPEKANHKNNEEAEAESPASGGGHRPKSTGFLRRNLLSVLPLLVLLAIAGLGGWRYFHSSALDDFWKPFIQSQDPVIFCIADQIQYSTINLRDAANPGQQITLNDQMVAVIIDDVSPLVNIAGLLQSHGRSYKVKGEAGTTFTDLRQGPAVFIGAYDNSWTLRSTGGLRFHFANTPDMRQLWIEDAASPSGRKWLLDRAQQATGSYKDYAIVARYWDANTDRPVVIAAGIARGGTVSAGEFLIDAGQMEAIASRAPRGWTHKNMEIVLETQVIDGRSGPPRVDAIHFW